jgi:hypothetical protein
LLTRRQRQMCIRDRLLPHINLKFVQDCLAKNQLFVSDPIFAKLKLA